MPRLDALSRYGRPNVSWDHDPQRFIRAYSPTADGIVDAPQAGAEGRVIPGQKIDGQKFADGGMANDVVLPSDVDPLPSQAAPLPSDTTPKVGTGESFARGVSQGATAGFSDELSGLGAAGGAQTPAYTPGGIFGLDPHAVYGLARIGYQTLASKLGFDPGTDATDAYNKTVQSERVANAQSETDHPVANIAGNVAGSLVTLPMMGGTSGATMAARAAQAARTGALYGGLYGAGSGEDATSRAMGAVTGAGSGVLAGGLTAPIAEGVAKGTGYLTRPLVNSVRGVFDPEGEALRRVATATQRDLATQGPPLSADELSAANTAGIPRALIDAGETTRALGRSAANTSPEGRAALNEMIMDRFQSQSPRAQSFVDNLVGGAGDVGGMTDALKEAARKYNRPAYALAYNQGSGGLWSPELERLTGSPAVVSAMKDAIANGQTRAIADGFGAFRPGVNITEDGRVLFNPKPSGVPAYPDLQFWDYTYRALRDAGRAATQSGRQSEGSAITNVAGQMRDQLDNLVPAYQRAREGAARFFGAQDALEAGQTFASSSMDNDAARKAVSAMSDPERQLFMKGYAAQTINRFKELGDNRDISKVFGNSPADRERAVIALGPARAKQLEAYLSAESVLDRARTAVQGNSTTIRQLTELGLAGGAYGISTHGDLTNPNPGAILSAAMVYGLARGQGALAQKVNESVSRRVAEMLASNDPKIIMRGATMLSKNKSWMDSMRKFDQSLATGAGAQNLPSFVPRGTGLLPAPAQQDQSE